MSLYLFQPESFLKKLGGTPLVGRILDLTDDLSVLNAVKTLSSELEVVTLHIDRPGLISLDQDAALNAADQRIEIGTLGVWLQRDIGHSLDWDMGW